MTSRSNETGRILDRFLEELGEPLPSTVRMRRASDRVLENLSSFDTFVDSSRWNYCFAGVAAETTRLGACGSGRGSLTRSGSPGRHAVAARQCRSPSRKE